MFSSLELFAHLGHLWPLPEENITPPPTGGFLLLETGSYILEEDGVSKMPLE